MSTENLEKDPAPSAIRYLVLASAFTCLVTIISFVQAQIGTSTQEEQFYLSAFPVFTSVIVISMLEWFVLKRSRKIIGPYGFAFVIEIAKFILFYFATNMYLENVSGASSPFFLHEIISLAIIFMLALTKVARTRIDQLAQKDISRNLLNLLPTILILALFLGTYVTEIVGLGTPRQRSHFKGYKDKDINWELYNTPTWDATYLLENLLDQFTAGLQNPYDALFNVSSDQSDETYPPAYWRIGSLDTYELHGTSSGTDVIGWWRTDPLGYRELTPNAEGTSYSEEITESEKTAQFTVKVPLDYSEVPLDYSVHNSFPNCLPTVWNGEFGSYVDADSFNLYDASDNPLTIGSAESQEIYPYGYDDFNDLLGIYADVSITDDTSSEEGIFEYAVDYRNISETILAAGMFSKTTDYYDSILSSREWSDIQAIYLQLPNTQSELPSNAYVHGDSISVSNYADWAPFVTSNASECTNENQTVFAQALADMQRLAPQYYVNTQVTQIEGLSVSPDPIPVADSTGKLGLAFDFDMWLGNQNPLQPMAHPEDNEDYNEWFIVNGNGVSLHFASLFVTLMRLRGIPSRVVVGYLGGEASEDGSERVISNLMLHAWAEVLIPIEEITFSGPIPTIDSRVEWVSFDPLLKFMTDVLPIGTPVDVPTLSAVANTFLINSSWPYQDYGPLVSLASPDEVNRTTVFDDSDGDGFHDNDLILNLTQTLNISVRVMMVTSLPDNKWMTWQPSCDYLDQEVDFWLATSKSEIVLKSTNVSLGSSPIDGSGLARVSFIYDVFAHGDTVWFFATVIFDKGSSQELQLTVKSDRYRIY